MPDQDKKVYCELSGREERYLNMYGPHSPANSDSPLSLVVRKEDHRKLGVVDSPGRSSGFSEGSYESSPNRSPQNYDVQEKISRYPSDQSDQEEKPLSLVIRKSNEETEEGEEGEVRGYWARQTDQDSGNDDSEPPLVISEDDKDQDIVHDFSTSKAEKTDDGKATEEQTSQASSGIKIKSFAKLFDSSDKSGPSGVAGESVSNLDRISEEPELVSDTASNCSNDSMMEGKPFIYGTELEMRRVSKSSSGETLYQCDFCDKLFANKYHLQSHLVTHTGERAFTCKVCQKTFGRKSTLRAHMTTHTKVSNFMCGVCEKACNDNNSLEEHMRMHTGEKPFVCSICQKAYARKSHLNVHYRVHTGERPFVCEYCNKDFTEKRFLNDHLQTAHNGVDGPLKCPNCSREFAYKTSLKQHLKKQMCERNIKRSHGNLNNGAVAKQFQCPFCDKSYSWKQTLKQHVSMYHRNKVHTDEFWRYELTKNRRTILDDKANEDLWKAQLGKHAEETARQKREAEQAARALAALDGENLNLAGKEEEQEKTAGENKWLEQINRTNNKNDAAQPSTEMKLMALQSLQNSLRFMSMGMNQNSQMAAMSNLQSIANIQDQVIKVEPASSLPPQESYLNLLAQIAKRESEERLNNNSKDSIVLNDAGDENRKETSSNDDDNVNTNDNIPVLPTKEESSVKRTQLWLQQVNKYRHRVPKEELDANHEELWEQQISRVKTNPVRSPLEPEEIIIEDELEAPVRRSLSQSPAPNPVPRISRTNTLNNNNINNNNNNNNNSDGVAIFPAQIILAQPTGPGSPGTATLTLSQQFLSSPGGSQLKVFLHQPGLDRERKSTDTEASRPGSVRSQAHSEDTSMLKSLLLDRMKRKRSSSIDTEANSKKSSTMSTGESSKVSKPISIPDAPNDILRKRLLGWVDPPPAPPTPKESPKEERKAADKELRSQPENCRKQEGNVFQLDLDTPEEEKKANNTNDKREGSASQAARGGGEEGAQRTPKNVVTYANTSVLKHLLHRYTETNQ